MTHKGDIAIDFRSVGELIPYARNARTHTDEQVTKIASSIREFGWTNPILVDGANGIIAGHGRLLAAKKLGLARVPVIELSHLSEAQKRAYILADNQLAISGSGWDEEMLRIELSELKDEDFDLSLTGFDDEELDRMLAEVEDEPDIRGSTDEDDVPEEQEDTVTRQGEVWLMGPHRLFVGDCTAEESYVALLQEQHVSMVVTDPPYNVAYKGSAGTIQNDDLGAGFYDFLVAALRPMLGRCDGACYIAMSSSELDTLQKAFRECGGHWSTFIIWAKDRFTLGRSDYQRQYEPLLYGWPEGKKHQWCGARDQGDVWQIKKPVRNEGHPTVKPIELFERCIRNSSSKGDIILDCFAGSGTTLIACEKSGRIARLMELDPRYADVIIRRWQDFTGRKATRESDGLEFDAVAGALDPSDNSEAEHKFQHSIL